MTVKKLNFTDIICLDLSSSTPYKLKKSLVDLIVSHGARVSFVLNKNVTFLIRDDLTNLDTYKCRTAFKLKIPIVSLSYLHDLVTKSSTNIRDYILLNKQDEGNFKKGLISLGQPSKRFYL